MTAGRPIVLLPLMLAALLPAGLPLSGGPAEAQDGRVVAAVAGDSALHAIAEDICAALMSDDSADRSLNGYQLAALAGLGRHDTRLLTRFSFFPNGNLYCRRDGMAVWATFAVDEGLPPREALALQTPPSRVLKVHFTRVAPPSPALEPDRLKAAAQAARGALSGNRDLADIGGYSLTGSAAVPATAAPRGGPQPIIPGSLNDVAGPPPGAARPAARPAPSPTVNTR